MQIPSLVLKGDGNTLASGLAGSRCSNCFRNMTPFSALLSSVLSSLAVRLSLQKAYQ